MHRKQASALIIQKQQKKKRHNYVWSCPEHRQAFHGSIRRSPSFADDEWYVKALFDTVAVAFEERPLVATDLNFRDDALPDADQHIAELVDALKALGGASFVVFELGQRKRRLHAHATVAGVDATDVDSVWREVGASDQLQASKPIETMGRLAGRIRYAAKCGDDSQYGLRSRVHASGSLGAVWAELMANREATYQQRLEALRSGHSVSTCSVCGGPALPARRICSPACRRHLSRMRGRIMAALPKLRDEPEVSALQELLVQTHNIVSQDVLDTIAERITICCEGPDVGFCRAIQVALSDLSPFVTRRKPLNVERAHYFQFLDRYSDLLNRCLVASERTRREQVVRPGAPPVRRGFWTE